MHAASPLVEGHLVVAIARTQIRALGLVVHERIRWLWCIAIMLPAVLYMLHLAACT